MKDEDGSVEMVSFCDAGWQKGLPPAAGRAYGEKQSLFPGRGKMPGN